ncbi:hypothetical protein [Gemmobacter sp. 24YEA27]|uniref:hypothetical protein n=1 Tax=Gemmobacter sp. 24YEA27 TaxID=3040672 RepID=UPI0024B390D9|nr:hypothetical protein [Gemmobacter sp. 24YEA27]
MAILRGIRPEEALAHVGELVGAGFTLIEVPLNSPAALESIAARSAAFGTRVIIGGPHRAGRHRSRGCGKARRQADRRQKSRSWRVGCNPRGQSGL